MIDLHSSIAQLEATTTAITGMASGITGEQARWKPSPNDWSILEVINHLYDEEREDFRLRLDLTLHHPETTPPPINPEGWVTERAYNERDLGESLERFLSERRQSLVWLRSLRDPEWARTVNHPAQAGLRAGDLLASWVAHDLLHMRQLTELRRHYLALHAAPYAVDYAGDW